MIFSHYEKYNFNKSIEVKSINEIEIRKNVIYNFWKYIKISKLK